MHTLSPGGFQGLGRCAQRVGDPGAFALARRLTVCPRHRVHQSVWPLLKPSFMASRTTQITPV
jgi:hypothetical protein